jgi:hypothetical protein
LEAVKWLVRWCEERERKKEEEGSEEGKGEVVEVREEGKEEGEDSGEEREAEKEVGGKRDRGEEEKGRKDLGEYRDRGKEGKGEEEKETGKRRVKKSVGEGEARGLERMVGDWSSQEGGGPPLSLPRRVLFFQEPRSPRVSKNRRDYRNRVRLCSQGLSSRRVRNPKMANFQKWRFCSISLQGLFHVPDSGFHGRHEMDLRKHFPCLGPYTF